jgi:Skp family chaperone for outer membrane proteins
MRPAILALILALCAVPVVAEPAREPLRIATFDLGRVVQECRCGKEGRAAIERRFATEKRAFGLLEEDLERAREDLRHSVFRPGTPQHREQVEKLRAREKAVREKGIELFERIKKAKAKLLREIEADLRAAVAAIAEEDELDLVLQIHGAVAEEDRSALERARQLSMASVFWAHARFDVTNRILARMDAPR